MTPQDEAAPGPDARQRMNGPQALRIKDLLIAVGDELGVRPSAVRPTVEATLKQLGQALAQGQVLNLPGLGRAKVMKPAADGRPMTIKLKPLPAEGSPRKAQEALAEDTD